MDHAMHGGARESRGEQEGWKERAVSLPGSSPALLLTHRRGNALSTLSFMNYKPLTHTHHAQHRIPSLFRWLSLLY